MEGMMFGMGSFLGEGIMQAVGWTLLHFLWQGALLALLLGLALLVARGCSAQLRYALSCGTLVVMALAAGATLWIQLEAASGRPAAITPN